MYSETQLSLVVLYFDIISEEAEMKLTKDCHVKTDLQSDIANLTVSRSAEILKKIVQIVRVRARFKSVS